MIISFSKHRVEEVNTTKSTRDKREDTLAAEVYFRIGSDVREDVGIAKFTKGKLGVISMSTKIFHAMQSLTKTTKSFAEILFIALVGAVSVHATEMNGSLEAVANVAGRGSPTSALVGNVILHTRLGIDSEFLWLDRTAKALIELSSILIVGIVLWVVNVLLGTVDAETLISNFKFTGSIAKAHEGENPDQDADGASRNTFESTNVDSLAVIT